MATTLATPIKSPVDTNEYRLIRLQNGLKVLLINCKETENPEPSWARNYPGKLSNCSNFSREVIGNFRQDSVTESDIYSYVPSTSNNTVIETTWSPSSLFSTDLELKKEKEKPKQPARCLVSLMINVGSHDDPGKFPGLAHLCEHLVHHGSVKFPSEEGYHQLVQNLNGHSNAFTDKDKTNYHFEVMQDESFQGPLRAMDMLADMIGYPLFPLDAVRREIESVDNEFYMRKTSTQFRRDFLLNQLIVKDEAHPLRIFCIGNKEKLMPSHVPNSTERLQDVLKGFQQMHYYAKNMNLVVQATLNLDELQNHVIATFGNIPSKSKQTQDYQSLCLSRPATKKPYDNERFTKFVVIRPCEEVNHLTIYWAFPPEAGENYDTKPLSFIGSLLSNGSPNGLESYLHSRNLIFRMFAGNSNHGVHRNRYASLFAINLYLTAKGRDEIERVIQATFSYMRLVRESGVTKEAYDGLNKLDEAVFKYFRPGKSINNIVKLTDNLRTCEKNTEILFGDQRLFQFDKRLINRYMSKLTPVEALYCLVTKHVGDGGFPNCEELYGTQYLVQDIPAKFLTTMEKVKVFKEFELPDWSSIAPKICIEVNRNNVQPEEPELLMSEPHFDLYYNPSAGMLTPQVGFLIQLATPWDLNTCVEFGIAHLWMLLLEHAIDQAAFEWLELGLDIKFEILPKKNRVLIFIIGLNYRMQELLDIVFQQIVNFEANLSEEKFEMHKQYIGNCLENPSQDSTQLSIDLLRRLKNGAYQVGLETGVKVRRLSLSEFKKFTTTFKSCVKIEMMVNGNATKLETYQIGEYISNKRYFGYVLEREIPKMNVNRPTKCSKKIFPVGDKCLRVKALNTESRMSTIHNYYALGKCTEESEIICDLLVKSISSVLFHQLRTVQQLGYVVYCSLHNDQETLGLSVIVSTQADKFCPCEIDSRIDNFFRDFHAILTKTKELNQKLLSGSGINRSRQYVLDYFSNHLVSSGEGSRVRKVSVQVVAVCGQEENPCTNQPMQLSQPCKKSTWQKLCTYIPRVVFAIECDGGCKDEGDNQAKRKAENSYFISDIFKFHKSCTN